MHPEVNSIFVAAHELKAPLSLMRQLALSFDPNDPNETKEYQDKIISVSDRALKQVSDLAKIARLEDGLFEIVSACATVGLTRNLTPTLNTAGKLIVTFGMYLGRIGPISMAFFFTGGKKNDSGVRYAEGNFYIG